MLNSERLINCTYSKANETRVRQESFPVDRPVPCRHIDAEVNGPGLRPYRHENIALAGAVGPSAPGANPALAIQGSGDARHGGLVGNNDLRSGLVLQPNVAHSNPSQDFRTVVDTAQSSVSARQDCDGMNVFHDPLASRRRELYAREALLSEILAQNPVINSELVQCYVEMINRQRHEIWLLEGIVQGSSQCPVANIASRPLLGQEPQGRAVSSGVERDYLCGITVQQPLIDAGVQQYTAAQHGYGAERELCCVEKPVWFGECQRSSSENPLGSSTVSKSHEDECMSSSKENPLGCSVVLKSREDEQLCVNGERLALTSDVECKSGGSDLRVTSSNPRCESSGFEKVGSWMPNQSVGAVWSVRMTTGEGRTVVVSPVMKQRSVKSCEALSGHGEWQVDLDKRVTSAGDVSCVSGDDRWISVDVDEQLMEMSIGFGEAGSEMMAGSVVQCSGVTMIPKMPKRVQRLARTWEAWRSCGG